MGLLNIRIFALTLVASLGGILFGYDTGFIGAAVTLSSFKRDFGITKENASQLSGNVVAMLQAGCFFGVLIMAFVTDKIGRRMAMIICGIVFDIGAIFQTVAKGHLPLFYVGRIVSGLAVGAASMLTPLIISEGSPKKIRGALLTAYGCMLFFGIALAYWIDYACQQKIPDTSSNQWRIPVGLQLVFGSVLSLGMIPLRESPRWLVKKNRRHEALDNLRYLRAGTVSDQEIIEEFAEVCEAVELEMAETNGVTWKEIFLKGNRHRFFITITIMIQQQLSGTNAFTYYAPIFFQTVGLSSESSGLFATGVYGLVKTAFSIVGMLFVVDRLGRKWSLLLGGFVMACALLIVAIIFKTHPPPADHTSSPQPTTYAMIVMIFLYCACYSMSWGPVPWTVISEISPSRLREYGIAAGSATQWAFNCMISKVVPIAIDSLGWRLFLMFAIFNFTGIVYTWFVIKETKGLSLEQMDELFGAPTAINVRDAHERAQAIAANAEEEEDLKAGIKPHVSHHSRV